MRVYIAGALSSRENGKRTPSEIVVDYLNNVNAMLKVAALVRRKGHAPFVPALDLLLGVANGDWTEEDYRGVGIEFLRVCEAVLVISWSWGVEKEVTEATRLGIPVYFFVEDLP